MKKILFYILLSFLCNTASGADFLLAKKRSIQFGFSITDFYDPLLSNEDNLAVRKSLLEGKSAVIYAIYRKQTRCPLRSIISLYHNGPGCGRTITDALEVPYKYRITDVGERELWFEIEKLLPTNNEFKFSEINISLDASTYKRTQPIKKIIEWQSKSRGGKMSEDRFKPIDESLNLSFLLFKIDRHLVPEFITKSGYQTTCISVDLPVEAPIYYYEAPAVIKLLWDDPSISIRSSLSGVRCGGGNSTSYEGKQTLSDSLPPEIIEHARTKIDNP
jgi:hypothetical protein